MSISATRAPNLDAKTVAGTSDPAIRNLVGQLASMHGRAVVIQDETGGPVAIRLNRSTKRLQFYNGTAWEDVA